MVLSQLSLHHGGPLLERGAPLSLVALMYYEKTFEHLECLPRKNARASQYGYCNLIQLY